jgi:hypothetical protein
MSLPQTSIGRLPALGIAGTISRGGPVVILKRLANGAVTPGRYVVIAGDDCAHPSAVPTPGTLGGLALRLPYKQNDGLYADNEMVDILVDGFGFVDPENTCTVDLSAYARYVTPTTELKGDFRSDAGGATGGTTITVNTAENTSQYQVTLVGPSGVEKSFQYTSDGTATTTEIATGLKTAIDADAEFVATNPTAPTILVVGTTITFDVAVASIDYRLSAASNSAAFKIPGAYYRTTGSGIIEVEFRQR